MAEFKFKTLVYIDSSDSMSISAKKQRYELEKEGQGKKSRKPKATERNEGAIKKSGKNAIAIIVAQTFFCFHYSTL